MSKTGINKKHKKRFRKSAYLTVICIQRKLSTDLKSVSECLLGGDVSTVFFGNNCKS